EDMKVAELNATPDAIGPLHFATLRQRVTTLFKNRTFGYHGNAYARNVSEHRFTVVQTGKFHRQAIDNHVTITNAGLVQDGFGHVQSRVSGRCRGAGRRDRCRSHSLGRGLALEDSALCLSVRRRKRWRRRCSAAVAAACRSVASAVRRRKSCRGEWRSRCRES